MSKVKVEVWIDAEAKKVLRRRATIELLTLDELISDILRRSVRSYRGNPATADKTDDTFITYFSRKRKKNR